MTDTTNITFYERVEDALQDTQARGAFDRATKRFTTLRAAAFTTLPEGEAVRDQARAIRAHTLSHLDQYLAQFADAVEKAGGQVHWAADAAEANRIISEIAQVNHVRARGQIQIDGERRDSSQSRAGSHRLRSDRIRSGRVHHSTGGRDAVAHHHAGHSQDQRTGRPRFCTTRSACRRRMKWPR